MHRRIFAFTIFARLFSVQLAHAAEHQPEPDVSARLEKHYLFLKRSDGTELRWTITKHKPVKEEQK